MDSRKFKSCIVLFLGFISFFNIAHPAGTESSIFAKATADIAFKKMMSDDQIAEALINDFFASLIADTSIQSEVKISLPIKIKGRGEENIPIGGVPGTGSMDFHAITANGDHIVIEMQAIHHDYFDRRALFYAASTFARQIIPRGNPPREEGRSAKKWYKRLRDVYAIQFIDNYFSSEENFKKYYKMSDVFSQKKLDGIHLIQIELKKIQQPQFPLSDDQAQTLQPIDWWYYIMKYSDQLTDEDVTHYQWLGMPAAVAGALGKLKKEGWSSGDLASYESNIQEITTFNEEKRRSRAEGVLEGQLESLIRAWAETKNLLQSLLTPIRIFVSQSGKPLSRSFTRKIFDKLQSQSEISQEMTLEDFERALNEASVLLE